MHSNATNQEKSKILVTGGAGFIGSHIVEELVNLGHEVIVFDNFSTGKLKNLKSVKNKIEIIHGDISKKNDVFSAVTRDIDYIFHEAALVSVVESIKNPHKCWRTNITGTIHVLNAAKKHNVKKIIFASSASVYGNDPKIPKKESMKTYPASPYAESKLMAEESFKKYEKHFHTKCLCLRYFNVYGPRQDPKSPYSGVISKFIDRMLEDKPPIIFGDGLQTRDFVYVKDIVRANILAMETENHNRIINIGTGKQTSLLDLIETLNRILNINYEKHPELKPIYKPERKGDVKYSYADITLARHLLKYEPKTKLEEGLRKTIEWIKENN